MIYLLSTQSILDILCGETKAQAWQKSVPANAVEVSAVSIGQALVTIQAIEKAARRHAFETALSGFVSAAKVSQGIIPFDEEDALLWADLASLSLPYTAPDGTSAELSPSSRMVVATALHRGATLVEAPQPYHGRIKGLKTVSF